MDVLERKTLSKKIWVSLKIERHQRETAKLDTIIEAGKGTQSLSRILRAPIKNKRICGITDDTGSHYTEEDASIEVFTKCYEQSDRTIAIDTDLQNPGPR